MSAKISSLVGKLQKGSCEDISESYLKLVTFVKSSTAIDQHLLTDIISCLRRDIAGKDEANADCAFLLFSCFHQGIWKNHIDENKEAFRSIFSHMMRATASSSVTSEHSSNIFSSMSFQHLSEMLYHAVYEDKQKISTAIKLEILKYCGSSSENQENSKPDICKSSAKILPVLLAFTVDDNEDVRRDAVRVSNDFYIVYPVQRSDIIVLMNCLKKMIMPKIEGFSKSGNSLCEVLTHQLPLFMKIIGVNIKKSNTLTNALLKVVESGFRHSEVDIKAAAFGVWNCFINCLAEDIELLSSSRYLKLLMQPLTAMQSCDMLNITRIKTLWGLACSLQQKLPVLFSTVCLPILHCCLGNLESKSSKKNSDSAAASSIKSRRSSSNSNGFYAAMQVSGYRATPKKASKSVQLQIIGVEVLIHLLEYPEEKNAADSFEFAIPHLDVRFLSAPATFNSYGQLLISAVEEVLCSMPVASPEYLLLLWNRLHYHVKLCLESNLQKQKRDPDLFNMLLLALQNIIESETLPEKITFLMLDSFLEFPGAILSSTFYGGSLNGVHGFPALTLLKLLLSKRLGCYLSCQSGEQLLACGDKLLCLGFENDVRVLSFCQSVIELLRSFIQGLSQDTPASSTEIQAVSEIIISLWSNLGKRVNSHILKSQEVNQGDSLDHDFSAMFALLLFPTCVTACNESCMEVWDEIYKSFQWCSGFVTTCKLNEICSCMSSTILENLADDCPDSVLLFTSHICYTMAARAEYNHGGLMKRKMPYLQSISSSKGELKPVLSLERHKNLSDLCLLVETLFQRMESNHSTELCGELMKCLCHLFSSIYYSEDIRTLFQHFTPILKNLVTICHADEKAFIEQLETIFHTVENVYKSSAEKDSTILVVKEFHSLICNCISHSNRKFQNVAIGFWENVVLCSPQHQAVCDSLSDDTKLILFRVYKNMGWNCPWKDISLPTSLQQSEEIMSENTQSSLPVVGGYGAFSSPVKKHSFLSPKKSPLNAVSPIPRKVTSPGIKRKLDAVSRDINYVKCTSPFPKHVTSLTERQKEKLSERDFIPPMYNELDEKREKDIEIDSQFGVLRTSNPMHNESRDKPDHDSSSAIDYDDGKSGDVIESSQSQESPRKKIRLEGLGKRNQQIDIQDPIIEENVAEDSFSSISSSVQLKDRTAANESDASEVTPEKRVSTRLCSDRLLSREACASLAQSNTCIGREKGSPLVKTSSLSSMPANKNGHYINDQVPHENCILIDDDDDCDSDRDLGVTPLDESYEYVEMVDMSLTAANVTTSFGQVGDVDQSFENPAMSPSAPEKLQDVSIQLERISDDLVEIPAPSAQKKVNKKTSKGTKKPKASVNRKKNQVNDIEIIKNDEPKSYHAEHGNEKNTNEIIGSNKNQNSESSTAAELQEAKPLRRSKRGKKTYSQGISDAPDSKTRGGKEEVVEPTRLQKLEKSDSEPVNSESNKHCDFDSADSPVQKTVNNGADMKNANEEIHVSLEEETASDNQKELDSTVYEYVEVADISIAPDKYLTNVANETLDESKDELTLIETEDAANVTSEYEYVEVHDMSIAADALDTSQKEKVDTGEVEQADLDESVLQSKPTPPHSPFSGTASVDGEEDFADALSSFTTECDLSIDSSASESATDKIMVVESNNVSSSCTSSVCCPLGNKELLNDEQAQTTTWDSSEKSKDMLMHDQKTQSSSSDSGPKSKALQSGSLNSTACDIAIATFNSKSASMPSFTSSDSPQAKNSTPLKTSPSAKGILKRRSTVESPVISPGSNKRRVSFAEPISKSQCVSSTSNHYLPSPKSSLVRSKKHSDRVSRRLSLQPDKKAVVNENQGAASPLSLRSVKVAEAIANIRAKDCNLPSRLLKSRGDLVTDFGGFTIDILQSSDFLLSLSQSQCLELYDKLQQISRDVFLRAVNP